MANDYLQKLRDPRWQKKRLEILERDNWKCQCCWDQESTLTVHHRRYLPGKEPWDYPGEYLVTLCGECHETERMLLPEAEYDLLAMLRILFFAEDVHRIASGFNQMELLHSHEVVASVYEWALSDPKIQKELIDRWFDHIRAELRAKTDEVKAVADNG